MTDHDGVAHAAPGPRDEGARRGLYPVAPAVPRVARGGLPAARLDGDRHPLRADLLEAPEDQHDTVFAGQDVGVRQASDRIRLVSFMDYDLGYFDDEECRLEPIQIRFRPKVLPMSPE